MEALCELIEGEFSATQHIICLVEASLLLFAYTYVHCHRRAAAAGKVEKQACTYADGMDNVCVHRKWQQKRLIMALSMD